MLKKSAGKLGDHGLVIMEMVMERGKERPDSLTKMAKACELHMQRGGGSTARPQRQSLVF